MLYLFCYHYYMAIIISHHLQIDEFDFGPHPL